MILVSHVCCNCVLQREGAGQALVLHMGGGQSKRRIEPIEKKTVASKAVEETSWKLSQDAVALPAEEDLMRLPRKAALMVGIST